MLKVSIIIPTYNRKELFEAALKSALAQDYENKEIIISDDDSNDGTRELAQNYAAKFDNVKYVLNQTYDRGPNGNKNNGFDHASGDAFVILDDDDLLIEGAISKMAAVLEQGYASVWANCYFELDGEPTTKFSGFGLSASGEISPQDYYDGKITGEFLIMFRRDAIGQRRFEKGLYGSENTLWIYLFDHPAYYLHDAVRIYRFHRSDSVTINSFKRPLCIMKGYAMTAELILQKIAEKNEQIGACDEKIGSKSLNGACGTNSDDTRSISDKNLNADGGDADAERKILSYVSGANAQGKNNDANLNAKSSGLGAQNKNSDANLSQKTSAEPKFRVNEAYIAILYKMAAYYAKFGGEYKKMYEYLFKSLKFKFTKEALAMLILSPFPKSMILFLTKIRVWIYKKTRGE